MATPTDLFWTIITIARVLAQRQNNMRQNVQNIQGWFHGTLVPSDGPSPLLNNLPATQQALRVFGLSTLQILAVVKAKYDANPAGFQAAAVAPLPTFAQLQTDYLLLFNWATNMNTVTLASGADLDTKVAALLAAVPPQLFPEFG